MPEFKTLPIIVASNLSQGEDTQKAINMGANGFLIKSETGIDEIVQKILAVCR